MSSSHDTKSSGQIEREVESSRADVESTLRALGDRMSPGQLVDQAYDYVKSSGGSEFAQNMGRQVRDNPLPLLLISAGIGWLFMGGQPAAKRAIGSHDTPRRVPPPERRPLGAPVESFGSGASGGLAASRSHQTDPVSVVRAPGSTSSAGSSSAGGGPSMSERAADAGSSIANTARDTGRSVADSVTGTASSIGDRISSASERAGGSLSTTYGKASDAASSTYEGAVSQAHRAGAALGDAASDMADRAAGMTESARDTAVWASNYSQERLARLVEEQPLILGGIGLALGAALGASLPRTQMENRLIGESADEFKTGVADEATRQYDHAKEMAGETYDEVAQAVTDSGVTEKLAEAATTAADKLREATEDASEKAREKIHAATDQAKQKIDETGKSGSGPAGGSGATSSPSRQGAGGSTSGITPKP